MRTWAWMLGGLLIWAGHFLGVYTLSSVADVVSRADDPAWRAIALGFSVACVAALGVLLVLAARRLRRPAAGSRLTDQLAALGAGLALIAVVWQALPTLIGY